MKTMKNKVLKVVRVSHGKTIFGNEWFTFYCPNCESRL